MRPLSEDRLRPDDRAPVMSYGAILFGIALLVSFIACSNVATLQSIRTLRRQTELTVRYALGSSRTKIVRLLFTESLFLYALGLLISVPIATWVMGLLEILPLFSWAEQPFDLSGMPVHFELQLDRRVIGFASMLTFVTALLFGLGTVLVGSQRYLTTNLHGDGPRSSAGPSRSRVQSLLLMSQVALCVGLLSGASLFGRTLEKAYGVDYGFRTAKVLILSVDFNLMSARYDKMRALVFYREVLERVRSLPNVLSATWGGVVPLSGRSLVSRFVPDDRTSVDDSDWIVTESDIVSPAYMRTLGITITEGRDFVDGDDENSQEVVIINETMARQYWPNTSPVGHRMRVSRGSGITTVEIVGVAQNTHRSPWAEPHTRIYYPLFQRYFPEMSLFVHVAGDPFSSLPSVVSVFNNVDSNLPVFNVKTLNAQLSNALSQQRVGAALLSLFGLLALGLAAVGVYIVTSFAVTRRTHEIGLRMALGAESRTVLGLVLREGLSPVVIGAALGLLASLGGARFIEAYLFGITPWDPMALISSIALLLLVVAAVACYVPARRASHLEPRTALGSE